MSGESQPVPRSQGLDRVHEAAPETAAKQAVEPVVEEQAAPSVSFFQRFAAAPWWLVSACLHVLLIALASLVTMAIEIPHPDDSVIMITTMAPPVVLNNTEPEKQKKDVAEVLSKDI